MARPSAYSRGRRIVMQVTMFGVLLATIGLAALVARSRERAVAVELETKPHLTDQLAIRLPKGWTPEQDSFDLPIKVTSHERAAGNPDKERVVTVYQTDTPPGTAQDLLKQYIGQTPVLGEAGTFLLLGEPGAIASFDRLDMDSDFGFGPTRLVPGWYAAGILQGKGPGGRDLGVVIAVEGEPAAGPAGRRLVRQLADGLIIRGRPLN
jgi:hypothetical protein